MLIRVLKTLVWCSAAFLTFVVLASVARALLGSRAVAPDRIDDLGAKVSDVSAPAPSRSSKPGPSLRRSDSAVEGTLAGDSQARSVREEFDSVSARGVRGGPRGIEPPGDGQPGRRGEATRELEPGVWQISSDERDRIRDSASDLLEEAEVRTYVNERTNRNEGMIIDHIESNSLLSARGLREGDVVQRINGTAVSSKSELINYVKGNSDHLYDVQVEILRRGKMILLQYHAPK